LASKDSLLYAEALDGMEDVEFAAATHLGRDDAYVRAATHGADFSSYPRSAAAFRERYDLPLFDSAEQFFEEGRLDAVCICTEDSLRARYAAVALGRGLHVFVARPFAVSLEESLLQLGAAQEGRAFLTPSLPQRRHPALQAAFSFIASERVGDVMSAHCRVARHLSLGGWKSDAAKAAGPELEVGFEALDALAWFMRDTPTSLYATGANLDHDAIPFADTLKSLVRFSRGGMASCDFVLTPHYRTPLLFLEVFGSEGFVRVEQRGDRGGMVVRLVDGDGEEEQLVATGSLPHAEMRHWIDMIVAHDVAANADHMQGALMTLHLCLALRQSWQTQQVVSLPLPLPAMPGQAAVRQLDGDDQADDTIL
jgi:predicted dehydrogenase